MKEDKYLKTLVANSTTMPEYNEDEDTENPIEDAEVEADCVDLLEHIGEEDFKSIYDNVIFNIRKQPIEKQITVCNNILLRIEQVYDFTFMRKLHIESKPDVIKVYKLIEFLEFNYVKIIAELLFGLIEDLRNIDFVKFYEENWKTIQNRIQILMISELISEFLRTNNKENLIAFLSDRTEKKKIPIMASILLKKEREKL